MTILSVLVPGWPVPQGSLKAFVRRSGGRPIVTADNVKTRPWKSAVAAAASAALGDADPEPGPVAVSIDFGLARPRGHYGAKGTVLPSAPAHHVVKPDLDKLVRAVLDALTEAGVWIDDSQVVAIATTKRYVARPGAEITVRRATR